MSEPLADRGILFHKLMQILHEGFVEARAVGYCLRHEQLTDLGDALHLLPELLAHWDGDSLNLIRDVLADYDAKHSGRNFSTILDMDDAAFHERYLRRGGWPEPEAVAAPAVAD